MPNEGESANCGRVTEKNCTYPRDLRGYWTAVHQIFTRCSGIVAARPLVGLIYMATLLFIVERKLERRGGHFRRLIGYHSNVARATAKQMSVYSSPPICLPTVKIW